MKRALAFALLLLGCSCAAHDPPVADVRFKVQPPVTAVNDRRDVPQRPSARVFADVYDAYDELAYRPVVRALSPQPERRAADVNALGEVPDSTWFTNRIGVRDLSPEEIRQGPNRGPSPMESLPLTIVSGKSVGVAPGFIVKDSHGTRYLLKFDTAENPEFESGADIVVQRILWALGYNVPEDYLIEVRRSDLVLGEDAVFERFLSKRPMRPGDVDAVLAKSHHDTDGRYRGIASQLVPGEPLGGFAQEGVRADDPNDLVPHERRRVLRGLLPIAAWLKHTDLKTANTLDAWVEDPRNPGDHYIVHYLIDFGKALGVMGVIQRNENDGYGRLVDVEHINRRLLTFGIWRGFWEPLRPPGIPGVGIYETEAYEPGKFRILRPYLPLEVADEHDAFWGSKLIMRFTEPQLRAAVEAAHYFDPRATDYLVHALVVRQRKTARYWFRRANPLDRFRVKRTPKGYDLCFDDLLLSYDLDPVADRTEYRARAFGYQGLPVPWRVQTSPERGGSACLTALPTGPTRQGYMIVRIETERPGTRYGPIDVHLAFDEGGALKVIGIWRR